MNEYILVFVAWTSQRPCMQFLHTYLPKYLHVRSGSEVDVCFKLTLISICGWTPMTIWSCITCTQTHALNTIKEPPGSDAKVLNSISSVLSVALLTIVVTAWSIPYLRKGHFSSSLVRTAGLIRYSLRRGQKHSEGSIINIHLPTCCSAHASQAYTIEAKNNASAISTSRLCESALDFLQGSPCSTGSKGDLSFRITSTGLKSFPMRGR
jgi:hypothetical protein